MPFPSRYGPVMNVVPWLIETDDEFPSASIKSVGEMKRNTSSQSLLKNISAAFNSSTNISTSTSTIASAFDVEWRM